MLTKIIKKAVDYFEEGVIIICMSGIAILTFGAVISRFVFQFNIAWSEELVRYLFVWGSIFGAAYAFKHNAHTGLPVLVEKLPRFLFRAVQIAILIISTALFLLIIYLIWGLVLMGLESGQVSPSTRIPYWAVNFGLMLALIMCTYRLIENVITSLKSYSQQDSDIPNL